MSRILLDTCVWGGAVKSLREYNHDVIWTGDWEVDPGDLAIIEFAHAEVRILVTLDKDFGALAVVKGLPHSGIIRLSGFRAAAMAPAIHYLVNQFEVELSEGAIITADPQKVRVRPRS
ncbi:MAG: DUF5615 family PIN-like protein [Verrucomicrobiales bacterium]|jgi:predicted nuclease of predicted toxin-antitoxin system|nr:DUF5615 family PIN-like protein [Verrucomicrobiales bacterium]MBP9225913.1 DUF5615 family PIN-like protein [Verrucomicrobiales bacterium]